MPRLKLQVEFEHVGIIDKVIQKLTIAQILYLLPTVRNYFEQILMSSMYD